MHKHVRGSALLATMLITAVVSGAIVYNLEHDLFQNALQENYILYQKEFANQKLALDTLRLRQQVENPANTADFGAFCAANKALSPKIVQTPAGKVALNSIISGKLTLQTPAGEKILSDKINLYGGAATVTFTTTSVPTVARAYILPNKDGLNGAEEFHYVDTAANTITSIKVKYLHPTTTLEITLPNKSIIDLAYEPTKGIMVNNKLGFALPTNAPTLTILFNGISKDLKTVYFTMTNTYSSASDMQTGPYALNLATKKITLLTTATDILE